MMNGVDRIESLFYVCILNDSCIKCYVATGNQIKCISTSMGTVKNTFDKILLGQIIVELSYQ